MELPGSGYLYALATISVTFVGFSALLLVFRQTAGGRGCFPDESHVLVEFGDRDIDANFRYRQDVGGGKGRCRPWLAGRLTFQHR